MKLKNKRYIGKENVYDIQIVDTKDENEHNFLLSNGLVSHNSELMNLRKCRYDDGIKVYADYANNEVRVLAGITQEDVMINMFKDGGDFHRMNASNILKKAPEFISEGERRFCKMSTFCILYGGTVYKVARDFMNGDLDNARKIVNGFFDKYKKIHKFIREKHYEGITTGKVTTAFGDYIDVQMPAEISKLTKEQINAIVYEDKLYDYEALVFDAYDKENDRRIRGNIAKGLRNSQNYPIQSWASSNAGYRIKQLSDYFRDANTSFRVDSFTHDSFTGDIKFIDLPLFLRDWKKFIVESTHKEFNVPVDADIEIGVMGDEMLEIKKSEVSDNLKYVTLNNVSGTLNSWELLRSKLEDYGVEIKNFEVLKKKVKTVSQDELFTTRRAFSMSIGKATEMIELNVELDFSNAKVNY